jgi:hypothetical protein
MGNVKNLVKISENKKAGTALESAKNKFNY